MFGNHCSRVGVYDAIWRFIRNSHYRIPVDDLVNIVVTQGRRLCDVLIHFCFVQEVTGYVRTAPQGKFADEPSVGRTRNMVHGMMVGFLLFLNSQIGGAFFMNAGNRVGEITPTNPTVSVNQILELNCTVYEDSGLNASMLFWEDYTGSRVPRDAMISAGERTLLFRKNITSVNEEGHYVCKRTDVDGLPRSSVGSAHLVTEYEPVRDVKIFSCILHQHEKFSCSWDLGKYKHRAYLDIKIVMSTDNGRTTIPCPQRKVLQNCTWTAADGEIGSMSRIVLLNITNKEFKIRKSFRRDYITRYITKYNPTNTIDVRHENCTECKCVTVSWEGLPGIKELSSRVSVKSLSAWNKDSWVHNVKVKTRLNVCNLVPASVYKVEIQLKPTGGKYYSEAKKVEFTTCSTAPSKKPTMFSSGYSASKCDGNSIFRTVTIYWKKIPKKNRNGKLTHYEITSDSGNQTRVGASNSFGYISIPCEGSRVISVRGCNRQGCSTEASITIPSYENITPLRFVVMESSGRSKWHLSWFEAVHQTAADIVWCSGLPAVLQCKDEIRTLRMNGSNHSIVLDSDTVDAPVDSVIFGVAILNEQNISSGIRWQKECRYIRNTVPNNITDVELLPEAPENSLMVSWSAVTCDASITHNVYVHSYLITYCEISSQGHCKGEPNRIEVSASGKTQLTIKDLVPDATYGVWVRAVSLTNQGPISIMVTGQPTNNDLSDGALGGIVVAGGFTLVLVLSGIVYILRHLGNKLGIHEKYPIQTIQIVPMKSMSREDPDINSENYTTRTPLLAIKGQSSVETSFHSDSQETLIKYLDRSRQRIPSSNSCSDQLEVIGSKGGKKENNAHGSVTLSLPNLSPSSGESMIKERLVLNGDSPVISTNYVRATTVTVQGLQQSSADSTNDSNTSQFESDAEECRVQWDNCYKKFEDCIPDRYPHLEMITYVVQAPQTNFTSRNSCEDDIDANGSRENLKQPMDNPEIENYKGGLYEYINGQNNILNASPDCLTDCSVHDAQYVSNNTEDWCQDPSDENDKSLVSVEQSDYVSDKIEDWCDRSSDENDKSLVSVEQSDYVSDKIEDGCDRSSDENDKSLVSVEQSDYVSNKIEDWCDRSPEENDKYLVSVEHPDYVSNKIEDWCDRSSDENNKSMVSVEQSDYVSDKIEDWCDRSSDENDKSLVSVSHPDYVSNKIEDWCDWSSDELSKPLVNVGQSDYVGNKIEDWCDWSSDEIDKSLVIVE
ncbi:uncharacterized protein LOC125668373 isoform X2 [Ostrea edulis]|uniref:uncharacterized protein LOC125668373 isoform X2 n=1 Tax=Ostrea edulis TaxID=37623 RepID=UPI0024AF0365|nr:uncharacterized protein LOC125668373 isoform X2 [Ostrea edulis]